MPKRFVSIFAFFSQPAVVIVGSLAIAGLLIGAALQVKTVLPSGATTLVVTAPIVGIGGDSSGLSFQIPGKIISVPVSLGQHVEAGAVLATLDQSSLKATRAAAVANLEMAKARLAALTAGTLPEQISVDQTTVKQAKESLRDVVRNAYINADDAVHNKADQFFINPRVSSAALSFVVSDQALQNKVQQERVSLETVLTTWGAQVTSPAFATSDSLADAGQAKINLGQVSEFLDTAALTLAKATPSLEVPLSVLQSYQTSINVARLNISASLSALTNATTALMSAEGTLTLAQTGPTTDAISIAQAAVDAAEAALDGIDVSLREAVLTAPQAGTIIMLNAHLGETTTPGQVLVSLETSGGSKKSALVVPKSSVIQDAGNPFVYVKNSAGIPTRTAVTTGLMSDTMVEITSGLSVGQEVLTFGTSTTS